MYPLLFKENLHTLVWGTEQWVVSAVEASPSIVSNGEFASLSLCELISRYPDEILGKEVARRSNGKMPLLAKVIDARQDLSIQVHPDDAMAARVHGGFGKSEMWFVINAEPGAYLYAGFDEKLTPEQYKQKVADGSIVSSLAKHEVHAGDVFNLPAGRVHAIGGGLKIAEIQQSSDITYRIFDYNRLGTDGKPRELHTELAAEACNFGDVRTPENTARCDLPLLTPFFEVRALRGLGATKCLTATAGSDSFEIIIHLAGVTEIEFRGDIYRIEKGTSALIPACIRSEIKYRF